MLERRTDDAGLYKLSPRCPPSQLVHHVCWESDGHSDQSPAAHAQAAHYADGSRPEKSADAKCVPDSLYYARECWVDDSRFSALVQNRDGVFLGDEMRALNSRAPVVASVRGNGELAGNVKRAGLAARNVVLP